MTALPPYVIEPPDILKIQAQGAFTDELRSISGKYRVAPDGNIYLGEFGNVYVAGSTVPQAQMAVQKAVGRKVALRSLAVDVWAYNSKTFYVITQSPGADNVAESPITGNETVLDAVAQVGVVPKNGQVWIARPAPGGGKVTILPVAWHDISAGTSTSTNYQLWPRDRLYIDVRPGTPSAN
jgi:protein involved in polysaccharide export with SLBB domain